MNKTVAFVVFSILALAGIAGSVFLHLERPDATATFATFVLQILGLVTVAAGTFYGLGKINDKVETVKTQTNGTLSALREDNARLQRENSDLSRQLPPKPEMVFDPGLNQWVPRIDLHEGNVG